MSSWVPDGWRNAKIDDVAEVVGGGTPSRENPNYWDGNIAWATPSDVTRLRGRTISSTAARITDAGLHASSATILPPRSLLVTTRATIGACCINDVPMATNQGFQSLVPRTSVAVEFLLYVIAHNRDALIRLGSGSTFPEVSRRAIRSLSFALPPIGEQHKIAVVLAAADETIEKTQAVIDELQAVKKAMMQELLTRGMPGRHTQFKQTELGDVAAAWLIMPCGDLFDVQLGKMMSAKARQGSRLYPYMRNENVQWDRLDLADVANMAFDERERDKFQLKEGDLLACEGRHIGKCAIWEGQIRECYYQKALHRLRAKSDLITTRYMLYYMMLRFRYQTELVAEVGASTTIPHLPREKLIRLPVLVPPRAEQDEIVSALDSIRCSELSNMAFMAELRAVKSALLSLLLTGELRVTPDPEPTP